jgi:hypothetical protein
MVLAIISSVLDGNGDFLQPLPEYLARAAKPAAREPRKRLSIDPGRQYISERFGFGDAAANPRVRSDWRHLFFQDFAKPK